MSVLNMKPDYIERIHQADGYEDANGDYIVGETTFCTPIPCSSSSNSKPSVLNVDNGKSVEYSYEIILPRGTEPFSYGEKVRFTAYGREPKIYVVLGFQPCQTYCKLWV